MMAILTPFKCSVRCLDAGGDGLQIEQRAAAGRAGHIIGLEGRGSRRPAECCRPAAGSGPRPASPRTRMASPMPSASKEPMTTEARSRAIFGSSGAASKRRQSLSRMGLLRPSALSLAASRRKAAMAGKGSAVLDRDQLGGRSATAKSRVGINLLDVQVLVNRLGPHVGLGPDACGATLSQTARVTTTRTVCSPPHLTDCRSTRIPASGGG